MADPTLKALQGQRKLRPFLSIGWAPKTCATSFAPPTTMTAMMSAQQASRIIMPRLCARSCSCARRSGFSSRRLGLIGVRVSGLSSLGQGERGRGGQSIIFFRSTKHRSPRHAREAPTRQQSCASRWRVCASARGLEESGYAYEHSEVRRRVRIVVQNAPPPGGRECHRAHCQGAT